MRVGLALLLLLLAGFEAVRADPPPTAPPAPVARPPPTSTPEQAADATLSAVKANDSAALKALAAKDDPDPWLVADELIRRGEFDSADKFASVAPRPDVERLAAYAASRKGKPDDAEARAAAARAFDAMRRRDRDGVAAALAQAAGDPATVTGVQLAVARAMAARATKDRRAEAPGLFDRAARDADALGWLSTAAGMYGLASQAAGVAGEPRIASDAAARRVEIEERRGVRSDLASALSLLAQVEHARGALADAATRFERALALAQAEGSPELLATVRMRAANLAFTRSDYAKAVELGEAARAVFVVAGNRQAAAATASNLGIAYRALGDQARAIAAFRGALADMEALHDRINAARTWANLGNAHLAAGSYAEAIAAHERALAIAEEERAPGISASMLGDLAIAWNAVGDTTRALECAAESARRLERLNDLVALAGVQSTAGAIHLAIGQHEEALADYRRALETRRRIGDEAGAAVALGDRGAVEHALRRDEEALVSLRSALEKTEAAHDAVHAARVRGNVAIVLSALGRHAEADLEIARAVADAERLGGGLALAHLLDTAAGVRLDLDDAAGAMERARRASDIVVSLFAGLGEEQGAGARERVADVFSTGARAAARLRDAKALAFFLERGRAATLLESLGGRERLRNAVLPDALRAAAAAATLGESAAFRAHHEALKRGDLSALRVSRAALEAARSRSAEVSERIQREAKREGRVVAPVADGLGAIQARLAPDEAMVWLAASQVETVALVATRSSARVTVVGRTRDLSKTCEENSLSDPSVEAAPREAALRRAIVEPLALPPAVRRVILSTDGDLSYVPFAALLGDRDIVLTPSGTTHGQLLDDGALRGRGVLALGDPDYGAPGAARRRSGPLARLPGSAAEAKAVGDPVLLGADASEAGLFDALRGRPRWRAVHLACHGLVDPEHPLQCALALTPSGGDDGMLFAHEVLRRSVPSDLAVLSACETAKGKIFRGEGIVGLTRAFMHAGAPRVICSLWKVDDEATRALMVEFYRLWNPRGMDVGKPGLPTAEALRKAQDLVRSHEKWKHPYYWAAWVLWGLPS